MAFELNNLKTDKSSELQGVWTKKIAPGAEFKIARLSSPAYVQAFQEEMQPYRDTGIEPPEEEKERIVNELTAKYIIIDWKGIELDGVELPYSYENAMTVLASFPELRGRIIVFAQNYANYKVRHDKEVSGN